MLFRSPAKNNRVEGNHIYRVMQTLSDGGGIYSLGRQHGSAFQGNVIHDVSPNAGRSPSNGVFMDEGSTDFLVESNVIYGVTATPIRFNKAGHNILRKNTLVGREPFRFNACSKDQMVFEDNSMPDPKVFVPPKPAELGAGRTMP